ncbi:two-component regulator propeller domain-containing protein [Siphonobacter sp. BAB-5405]|uniref:two-component regulator propeller domain-containing protein n=1 Tax=Siphonobacter sp. BAB-5405 TaxID=1864825 RepID=UPI001304EEFB|nr:two-component regulator propeller domain-containing protein [Siphonobacter sp. BAB-5405]
MALSGWAPGTDSIATITRNFSVFKNDPSDSTTLSDNYILSLLSDSRGKLWVGTTQGLNYYDSRNNVFHRLNSPLEKQQGLATLAIHCLFEDSKGSIWVGTSAGVRVLTTPRKPSSRALLKAVAFPAFPGSTKPG